MVGEASQARRSAYVGRRPELLGCLPQTHGPVVDVGCSNGEVGAQIKRERGPHVQVWGIEIDPQLAAEAATRVDRVLRMDALRGLQSLREAGDCPEVVMFGDSLEHMEDPWTVFDEATAVVRPGGWILVSLPNVAHWDTLFHLLRGTWPHRERGIHDDTHLRFFARRDVEALMNRGRSTLVSLTRVYRLVERPAPINRWAHLVGWLWPNGFTYQYIALSSVDHGEMP